MNGRTARKAANDPKDTWFILFYNKQSSVPEKVLSGLKTLAAKFEGAVKVGAIECPGSEGFCIENGVDQRGPHKVKLYSVETRKRGGDIVTETDSNALAEKALGPLPDRVLKISTM